MTELHVFKVGEPFAAGKTRWPEGPRLSITPSGAHLTLFFDRPDTAEVKAVRRAPARFAWIRGEQGAVLAFNFIDTKSGAGVPWSDAPYHHALQPDGRRDLPGDPGTGMFCTIMLIDASTGIIKAIRGVSWPAAAADAVRDTFAAQLETGYHEQAFNTFVDRLYARYPDTGKLVSDRADVTWTNVDTRPGAGPMAVPPL
ncbi:hypothetical protein [Glycomyces sp. YM15]|uniref:hypothetical protein n=1 Tax=Glycomyces sp. YM15 TaxID=2800446 RepID=UPI001963967D|nr:hypothetical protein [Glycomyces sp. YM15]